MWCIIGGGGFYKGCKNIILWYDSIVKCFDFLYVIGYLFLEENRYINDIVLEICENLLSFNEIFNIECMNINI